MDGQPDALASSSMTTWAAITLTIVIVARAGLKQCHAIFSWE
jgi:hypothetical protein